MPLFVYAPVLREARHAFELAAGEDQRVGGVIEDEATGQLEVTLELEPRRRGIQRGARPVSPHRSGCRRPVPDQLQMTVSGFETLMTQSSEARGRLVHARELQKAHEYAVTVVVAQTACEVLIREVLPALVQPHVTDDLFPWALERVRQYTLNDRLSRITRIPHLRSWKFPTLRGCVEARPEGL